ncbi:MAG: HAMP domain-containing histidine kinase [Alistipes sp.]|nr:HAMP domain-containing histidine kinase [Alistipes sp.]
MNRTYFRNLSLVVVSSLTLLAAVQCFWAVRMYREQVGDFQRRVESSAYKAVYKSFRMDAIPGLVAAKRINIDLDDFAITFNPNLLELDALTAWRAEIIDRTLEDRVVMRRVQEQEMSHPRTALIEIDDDGVYLLRLTYEMPINRFWGQMWVLMISSVLTVLLLALVLAYLVRTMKRQRTLEEMRRDFTHNITHELKTPISVAVTATDALRNFSAEADAARRSRYLEIIESQLTQLSAMVEHILAVSVEGRTVSHNPTRILLAELLEEVTVGLRLEKRAEITISCPSELTVEADRFHLRNLLTTLLDNALKYTRRDPILHLEGSTEEEQVVIQLTDNGCGIAPEHQPYLFEKFYRVPQGDVQSVRGYGLGLYYARRVAERHEGTITVKSRVGEGSTFTLKIPAHGC